MVVVASSVTDTPPDCSQAGVVSLTRRAEGKAPKEIFCIFIFRTSKFPSCSPESLAPFFLFFFLSCRGRQQEGKGGIARVALECEATKVKSNKCVSSSCRSNTLTKHNLRVRVKEPEIKGQRVVNEKCGTWEDVWLFLGVNCDE